MLCSKMFGFYKININMHVTSVYNTCHTLPISDYICLLQGIVMIKMAYQYQ